MLLPFVSSSLIADGVMPGRGANGVMMMVICTGNGMVEMAFDAASMTPVDDADPESDERSAGMLCAWAAGQFEVALPPLTALALPKRLARRPGPPGPSAILDYARATGLPPATGPPVTGLT